MPTITPNQEFVSGYLKELMQDELRAMSCLGLSIPGITAPDVTPLGMYKLKDCSSMFTMEGRKSRTQKIPRVNGLVANTYIQETEPTFQTLTRSYRNISIDPTIGTFVKFNQLDTGYYNIPIDQDSDVMPRIARAIAEKIHREAFLLVSDATQATLNGSNIGGATTVPSLTIYSQLNKMSFVDKHKNKDKRYLVLTQSQAQDMALNGGIADYQPQNSLGDRGIKQYETGLLMQPVVGIQTITSDLLPDGSTTDSTHNLFIVGEGKIGYAISNTIIKNWEDNDRSQKKIKAIVQYGLFILDERHVYRTELAKN